MTSIYKLNYIVEFDNIENIYVAECLEYPGLLACGHSKKEAKESIIDMIKAIRELEKKGK